VPPEHARGSGEATALFFALACRQILQEILGQPLVIGGVDAACRSSSAASPPGRRFSCTEPAAWWGELAVEQQLGVRVHAAAFSRPRDDALLLGGRHPRELFLDLLLSASRLASLLLASWRGLGLFLDARRRRRAPA